MSGFRWSRTLECVTALVDADALLKTMVFEVTQALVDGAAVVVKLGYE